MPSFPVELRLNNQLRLHSKEPIPAGPAVTGDTLPEPEFPLHPEYLTPEPLPGDGSMPRVQSPNFGASQRMVVAPGREAEGIAHMPGGQSGHLLSPFWGAGHDDWVHGRPTPFLPGEATHALELVPAAR